VKTFLMICFFGLFLFPFSLAEEPAQNISFALVGDILLGTDYPDSTWLPEDEGRHLIKYAQDILSSADVAIGNLEGAITSTDSCVKVIKDSIIYAYRMPPFLAPRLAEAGFDVLNTANNHAGDFGIEGRLETESILDSLGIAHTGRYGDIATLEVRGLHIAVVGFSTFRGTYSLLDINNAAKLTKSLDSRFDIVVVTFHGGAEGKQYVHLPDGQEYFLGEKRGDLRLFAHRMIDAGADVVFGHGPHVPRAVELYKRKIIAYSLGNFCTWFGIDVRGINGLAPLIWIELDSEGDLVSMKIFSFEQQTCHYPLPDPERKAEQLIINLSKTDIGVYPF